MKFNGESIKPAIDTVKNVILTNPNSAAGAIIAITICIVIRLTGTIGFIIDIIAWAILGILITNKLFPETQQIGGTGGSGQPGGPNPVP